MRFKVPVGGPGKYVYVTPPGRSPLKVYIPTSHKVGDTITVAIPDSNSSPNPAPSSTGGYNPALQYQAPNTRAGYQHNAMMPGQASRGSTLMKVVCPSNLSFL